MDSPPPPPPFDTAPLHCVHCGTDSVVWTGVIARLDTAASQLAALDTFTAEIDARQYCPHCTLPRPATDLRTDKRAVLRGGWCVRVVLRHSELPAEDLWIDFVQIGALVELLNGEPVRTESVALRSWWNTFQPKLGRPRPRRRSALPGVVDFGTLQLGTPVTRTLRLCNPDPEDAIFTIHGVLAPPELSADELPAILSELPFRIDLAESERFYRGNLAFEVPASSEIEVAIVGELRPGTVSANDELTIHCGAAEPIVVKLSARGIP